MNNYVEDDCASLCVYERVKAFARRFRYVEMFFYSDWSFVQ